MHIIEPFFNWRHQYIVEEDKLSPFYGTKYNEFEYTNKVYNYFIHPQWDFFGSETLYLKIICIDYELNYCIIEFIGEWNDAIENDIMTLKREVIDKLFENKIFKFVLIGENIFNFHSGDKDYYDELNENINDVEGWIVCLNMNEAAQFDFKKRKLHQIIELMEIEDWRTYKPYHLYKKIDSIFTTRLLQ